MIIAQGMIASVKIISSTGKSSDIRHLKMKKRGTLRHPCHFHAD